VGMKTGHNQVAFMAYTMDQPLLLLHGLEELVPEDHLV
jgi:hypothetical protein